MPLDVDINVPLSVPHLLMSCFPLYIAGLVIPVIINSMERVFVGWPWADIGIERSKVIAPFGANIDAAPAV